MPLVKFQATDTLTEALMDYTGHRVASKAFLSAAMGAPLIADELIDARTEIAALKEQIKVYQQAIARARDAAIEFAELASQGDLFQPKETAPARLRHHLTTAD